MIIVEPAAVEEFREVETLLNDDFTLLVTVVRTDEPTDAPLLALWGALVQPHAQSRRVNLKRQSGSYIGHRSPKRKKGGTR